MYLLTLVVMSAIDISWAGQGLTSAQKQELLDYHNAQRRGEGASDMTKMTWDENLENMAQETADTCQFDRSSDSFRNNKYGYENIGENIFKYSCCTSCPPGSKCDFDAERGVSKWWDEKRDYDINRMFCRDSTRGACGQYKQMAWALSHTLGCALKYCSDWSGFMLVCNYGPGGNYVNKAPYTKGSPCSECPCHHQGGCEDGLCLRSQQDSDEDVIFSGRHGGECRDKLSNCVELAGISYCNYRIRHLKIAEWCPKSCNLCDEPPCSDKISNCAAWAGYCTEAWLTAYCPLTCNSCGKWGKKYVRLPSTRPVCMKSITGDASDFTLMWMKKEKKRKHANFHIKEN